MKFLFTTFVVGELLIDSISLSFSFYRSCQMHSATQLVKSSPIEISSGLGQRPAGSLCVASPKVGVTNCPPFPGAEVFFLPESMGRNSQKKISIYKHMYNSEVEMISQTFFLFFWGWGA